MWWVFPLFGVRWWCSSGGFGTFSLLGSSLCYWGWREAGLL